MTPSYARIADLPVVIDTYGLEPLHLDVSSGFTRVSMIVRLRGGGLDGVGEDVSYDDQDQNRHFQRGAHLPLAGDHTLDSFSRLLDEVDLYPDPLEMEWQRPYRRWAYESAALDLALRQAGTSLAGALGLTARPVRFVVSMGLGEPPDVTSLQKWIDRDPGLRFKLDATSAWTEEICRAVSATGAVDVIDLKGQYRAAFAPEPDAALYRRVASAFPDVWIEDPDLSVDSRAALAGHEDRITWDAPIHCVDDVRGLSFPPRCLNLKPSRFGTLHRLLDTYDYIAEQGIAGYGGGQFELGPGRGQIQCLAALFHPDGPNDVAPGEYNAGLPPAELPPSPLPNACAATGFRGALDEPAP